MKCLFGTLIPTEAYDLGEGAFEVKVVDEYSLFDSTRERNIPLRIYYPVASNALPVILFSHGLGGNKNGFSYWSRFLASHGYVVIHPSHDDTRALQLQRENNKHQNETDPNSTEDVSEKHQEAKLKGSRTKDLRFILDSLDQIVEDRIELRGLIDPTRCGVAGHSAGAFATLQMGGLDVFIADDKPPINIRDYRVRAIMPISARGIGQGGMTEKSWEKISIPMMVFTGSKDDGGGYFGGQTVERRTDSYRYSPPGQKYLVFIEGATHSSYGGWRREPGEARSRITEYDAEQIKLCVMAASLAFWDANLKQVEKGKLALTPAAYARFANQAARLEAK